MILVVDDEKAITNALRTALESVGYEVVTASNGGEAYEYVKRPECKCVLLDVNMPEVNGIELLLLMQADGLDVPTIVMAGFDDFEDGEMTQFTNVVKFFPKPFEFGEMLKAVHECIG